MVFNFTIASTSLQPIARISDFVQHIAKPSKGRRQVYQPWSYIRCSREIFSSFMKKSSGSAQFMLTISFTMTRSCLLASGSVSKPTSLSNTSSYYPVHTYMYAGWQVASGEAYEFTTQPTQPTQPFFLLLNSRQSSGT